jgi:hypothetical protein
MNRKQLQQVLRVFRARLKLEESRLAVINTRIAAAEGKIAAARVAATDVDVAEAHVAAEKLYRASRVRLKDGEAAKDSLMADRGTQIQTVAGELKRKLIVEKALKR